MNNVLIINKVTNLIEGETKYKKNGKMYYKYVILCKKERFPS